MINVRILKIYMHFIQHIYFASVSFKIENRKHQIIFKNFLLNIRYITFKNAVLQQVASKQRTCCEQTVGRFVGCVKR